MSGFDISRMRTDQSAENDGVWIDFEGGLRLKIARLNNDHHQEYMMNLRRKYQKTKRMGEEAEIGSSKLRELSVEGMVECILLGWDNMIEEGKAISYSKEEATRLLTEYREFYRLVEEEAANIDNFRAETEAEELGNSESSADGTDGGATL